MNVDSNLVWGEWWQKVLIGVGIIAIIAAVVSVV